MHGDEELFRIQSVFVAKLPYIIPPIHGMYGFYPIISHALTKTIWLSLLWIIQKSKLLNSPTDYPSDVWGIFAEISVALLWKK